MKNYRGQAYLANDDLTADSASARSRFRPYPECLCWYCIQILLNEPSYSRQEKTQHEKSRHSIYVNKMNGCLWARLIGELVCCGHILVQQSCHIVSAHNILVLKKVKVCFIYLVAQYPVSWTAQSTLYFTPWQTCSFRHQHDFSCFGIFHSMVSRDLGSRVSCCCKSSYIDGDSMLCSCGQKDDVGS